MKSVFKILITPILFLAVYFLNPISVSATTWNAVVDDTFNRSNTSTGIAGSTTGVGNSWIDVAGGVWNLNSNQLQGYSNSSSDYLTKFLTRPSSENTINQRIVATIPAGENFGQFLGLVLRYQSSTNNHYLAHISASGIYLYKVVGGSVTSIATNSMSIDNSHSYSVDFSAVGTNSTTLSVVVTDLTTSTQIGTASGTDSAASLQGGGSLGLSTWYNSGTNTTHATRVQTYNGDLVLTGSTSYSGTSGVAMPITDLQISGDSNTTTPVKLLTTSGTLAMSTTTGLTFTGGQTGSTLYFSGTVANINAALATLTYTRSGTGTDTLEVSLVNSGEVFFSENNHLYKFISGSITWNNANTAAPSQTAYGVSGYLATITSQAENDFVAARLVGDGWFGASDSATEGNWKWVTGPETNTQFWSGAGGGNTVNGQYANWASGEPNDSGSNEDCAQFYISTGKWNDLPCSGTSLSGYVVEFGTTNSLPIVVARNVSITTSSTPTVSSFSPSDNAINVSTSANLVITFSQAVTAGSGNILIKKSSDDSTVETIDVTSGQVTGGGTTTITINPNITLTDSTGYYVTIPNTAFKNGSNAYYAGISSSTAWNFTTGDYTAPTITSVTSNKADGYYKSGENINITVTFSEAVTSTGNVTVTLETGSVDETCTFSVSSSTTGSCTYTVVAGDNSSDLNVSTISGTIKDANLNTLTNFTPSSNLADSSNIVIDTTAPVLTQTSAVSSPVNGTSANYNFSTTESGTYTLSSCGSGGTSTVNGDTSVDFTGLTPGATYSCTLYVTDLAGNVSNTLNIGSFLVASPGAVPIAILQAISNNQNNNLNQNTNNTKTQISNKIDNISNKFTFKIDMKKGSSISDVRELQKFLKSLGNTIYPDTAPITGYFGPITHASVIRFQELYPEDILVPINAERGTGIVGIYTRTKLNKLISEN